MTKRAFHNGREYEEKIQKVLPLLGVTLLDRHRYLKDETRYWVIDFVAKAQDRIIFIEAKHLSTKWPEKLSFIKRTYRSGKIPSLYAKLFKQLSAYRRLSDAEIWVITNKRFPSEVERILERRQVRIIYLGFD